MSLSFRQKRTFRDKCDLYRFKFDFPNTTAEGEFPGWILDSIKTDITCLYKELPLHVLQTNQGRLEKQLSKWHVSAELELKNSWILQLKTENHLLYKSYWKIIQINPSGIGSYHRSQSQIVLAERCDILVGKNE